MRIGMDIPPFLVPKFFRVSSPLTRFIVCLDWYLSTRAIGRRWSYILSNPVQFADLGLADALLRAISDTGYTHPTPIQAQAIPQVLEGTDLLAAAQTGTGKTAGFTLPILHRLVTSPRTERKPGQPRVLILAPTRELCAQVETSVRTYARHTRIRSTAIFGGVNINPQINTLRKPIDVVVATPGRLLDHAQQKTIDLSGIEILVLDEADRMLDMGFIHDIRRIISRLPKERQNLLFSATFSSEIRSLSKTVLTDPAEISVAARNTASELVTQQVVLARQSHKRDLVSFIIRQQGWHQVLVFTRTKHGANRLADRLVRDGLSAAAIHGNKSQAARTRALNDFKKGKVTVLVATDIAARGLDIDQLPFVINFELPNVPEDYVHRIGRTGRAGSEGSALSLVDDSEIKLLKGIEKLMKRKIERTTIEGWSPDMVTAEAPDAREFAPRPSARRPSRPRRDHSAPAGSRSAPGKSRSHSGGLARPTDSHRAAGRRKDAARPDSRGPAAGASRRRNDGGKPRASLLSK